MDPGLPPAHAVALALWAVGATILIARARRRRRAAADSVAVAAAAAPPLPPAQVLTEQQPEGGPAAVSLSPPVDPRLASLRRKVSVVSPQALGQGSDPPIPRPPYLDAALLEVDNSLRERSLSSASSSQTVLTPSSAASVGRRSAAGPSRSRSFTTTAADRKLMQVAPFSPAIAHWELAQRAPGEVHLPSAWEFDAALLFVDISGFTNLCTRLDIDALQRHINLYFGDLIDVVTDHGGDVLRFAGDALYCAWSLTTGAHEDGTLALATRAACHCALELTRRCGTYAIPEAESTISIHSGIGAGALTAYRVGANARWEFLIAGTCPSLVSPSPLLSPTLCSPPSLCFSRPSLPLGLSSPPPPHPSLPSALRIPHPARPRRLSPRRPRSAGDPLRQSALAEGHAALGETALSAEAWALVSDHCEAEPCGHGDGAMRLLACSFGGIGGGAGGSEALVRARPRSVLAAAGNGPASSSGGSPPTPAQEAISSTNSLPPPALPVQGSGNVETPDARVSIYSGTLDADLSDNARMRDHSRSRKDIVE